MRTLIIDAETFQYNPTNKSASSGFHNSAGINKKSHYSNCLVMSVSVEKKDNIKIIPKMIETVKEILKETEKIKGIKNDSIVILPNVHLTNNPMGGKGAYSILEKLYEALHREFDADKIAVHLEAFGFSGPWSINANGHRYSVLGRSFK